MTNEDIDDYREYEYLFVIVLPFYSRTRCIRLQSLRFYGSWWWRYELWFQSMSVYTDALPARLKLREESQGQASREETCVLCHSSSSRSRHHISEADYRT